MKPFRPVFTLAVFCLLGSFAQAQEFSFEKGLTPQQVLNEMVASSKYRPKQVATLETFEIPLVIDGRPSGSAVVKAGSVLEVVSVKPDGVVVEIHGNQIKLAIDKTDIIARYADRKIEVDQEIEKDRQALIAEGEQIWVAPPPVPVVAAVPEQVTKVVYVDSSQPRIQVNNGNYWPYTSYSPGYAASYVIQPYYQYYPPYCQPVNPVCPPVYKPAPPRTAVYFPTSNVRQVLPPVVHPFSPPRPP